ncbi:threonine synthase [Dethiosulfatarculus sandiegensis]|uniref:Threonine synthase n=1 Tax=Dethiosulfatarculus sandiegensis TaxID=1429043 RepID=A0A0D2J0M5_9BACT|nr:threonine synthase [Dethiosulfatarculus sandiegensis]KIX11804.1 threonine synthase [Dethiosulfatarculus sandiegensis]
MHVTHLECSKCKATYDSDQPAQLCEKCGAPLLVRYDLAKAKADLSKESLKNRKPDLWRYRELLPVEKEENIVTMGEGMTPLLPLKKVGSEIGVNNLFLKDEGILPTGSFKARGAAVGVSRAKELGVKVLAMPTAGNAGGAWSAYCTSAGIEAVIVMPEDAQEINIRECLATGGTTYLVKGIINDAGQIVAQAVKDYGWYDASTLKEPYRIEGKKTMGFEIAEQMGWDVPDVLLYPTGGGVGIIAIQKALQELKQIGWIGDKMPRLVSVQSSACAPIPKAWEEKKAECDYWQDVQTKIPGLRVPKALGDFLVLKSIYETNGCAVAVSDQEALEAQQRLAATEGTFICPEGGSTLAAAEKLVAKGWIKPDEKVVLLNTGSGLKYPDTVQAKPLCIDINDKLPKC